jgi:hypothetical protein
VLKDHGFPASSAGQALLPPAYRRQAGMTKWEKFIASRVQEIFKKFLKRFYR